MKTRSLQVALAVVAIPSLAADVHAQMEEGAAPVAAQPAPQPVPMPAPQPEPMLAPQPEPMPAPQPEVASVKAEAAQPSIGYKGGFVLSDGDANKLTIQGRVQSRLEFESIDEGDSRSSASAFSIPRARLTLKGHAYSKAIGYKFQTDFGKGSAALKDFYVDYQVGESEIRVRTGQFKKPFARTQLTSSSKLEFVDRNLVDKAFGNGRDLGIELHNNLEKSPSLEWAVGVFNGSGDKGVFSGDVTVDPTTGEGSVSGGSFSNVPADIRPALVARIGHNSDGMSGYSEADLEGGPLRFGVAAATMVHFSGGTDNATARVGADFIVKNEGLSVTGGVYAAEDGPDVGDLSYTGLGAYAQVGYVLAKVWQPALRYALLSLDGGDKKHEVAAGLSLYNFGHGFKWQSDVALLADDVGGTSTSDIRARTQLQLTF